jgi:hypothetical protein
MPWNSGVYTRGYASWVSDANNSLPISATKFDTEDNDFAAGLNNCLTIDGLNKPNATLNWAVQMNWTRGTDGNLWSLARTGGSNNPRIQASVLDASGVTLAVTGGGLTLSTTAALLLTSTGFNVGATTVTYLGPVAGTQVDMTPDKGSWTTTLSGPWLVGNNPTGTLKWERQGTQVTIWCDSAITQTSIAGTALSASALPAAITPSSTRACACTQIENNGSFVLARALVETNNTIAIDPFGVSGSFIGVANSFTSSGAAGIAAGWSIVYSL